MRILFCKIAYMKYYKFVSPQDPPINGGSYVKKNGYGHEEINFFPIALDRDDRLKCVGFFEPKSNNGKTNTVHIENIEGCAAMKNEPYVEDVLVVWCATDIKGDVSVVGWYKHATVFRNLQDWTLELEDGEEERVYNVLADAENCTLLPAGDRNMRIWHAPSARRRGYGFGQSMVWYPTEEAAQAYVRELTDAINRYTGENWLNKFPE